MMNIYSQNQKMTKIDLKDRKILYELDLNCRQSNTQIGKKVGLKKDLVAYRIKKMEDEGIIKFYWTAIDTFKLGYNVFRIYVSFQYVNSKVKQEIIQHFINYHNTWTVKTHRGEVDLAMVLWVKNIYEFYRFWDETLDKYEDFFSKAIVSIYIHAKSYKKSYILPNPDDVNDREMYTATCSGETIPTDEIDYKILNELAVNARIPLIQLADKLKSTSQVVNYRIKNLQTKGIIQAYRVHLDLPKLGLQHFKIDIYLKEHKKRKAIIDYLKQKPFFECLNVSVGWCDIEPEFIVKDVDELTDILADLDGKFPNSIKKQSFWILDKNHKERWLPEMN